MGRNEDMRSRCEWCKCCDVYRGRAVECGGFSMTGLTQLWEVGWVSVPSPCKGEQAQEGHQGGFIWM